MPNTALFPERESVIVPLEGFVDGYPREEHQLEATLGEAPLEDGANLHDHVTIEPKEITLHGSISDVFDSTGTRHVAEAYQRVVELWQAGERMTVVSELDVYDHMVITNVSAPRRGPGLDVTIKLREVQMVGLDEDAISADTASGPALFRPSNVNHGRQSLIEGIVQTDTPSVYDRDLPSIEQGSPTNQQLDLLGDRDELFAA